MRHFAWSFSKDAKHGANEPERMTLPGEEEAGKRAEEEADHDAIELARVFGLNI